MAYPKIDLAGAVVAITGGTRGIGKSTAELFADRGATVASDVPLGHGLPTVDPEVVARAIVGSVDNRRAEITVPRYLAGWDLLNAAAPERLMRLGRKLIGDRRALTAVDHDVRAAYEQAISAQAREAKQ